MKPVFRLFIAAIFISLFSFQNISACSIYIPPLRKEFRKAKAVFAGKILKIEDYYVPTEAEKQDIPEHWTTGSLKNANIFSRVTIEIKNKWKGRLPGKKTFVAVSYWGCGCPGDQDRFKEGEEYVLFIENKNFITVCDSWREKVDGKEKLIKKLDDFRFRSWARIYPF
jgi:hypothetical protein